MSLLIFVIIMGVVSLLAQSNLISEMLNQKKDSKDSTTYSNKMHLVSDLSEQLSQEIALQFSRYSTNSELEQCLKGDPTPCDETQTYDMVLYAPVLEQSFQGGAWPAAPAGALLIAGGKTKNVTLHRFTGSRCPDTSLTAATDFCPLQPIIQFKPLCGGTNEVPALTVPGGGPCTGPATGFDITVGVARYMNGTLIYHANTNPGGDAQVFRFSSNVLRK